MVVIADVRALDSKYMNATTHFGVAFRSGVALLDDERKLAEILQLEGVQVIPRFDYVERLPTLLNTLGPFKPVRANVHLPEGYKLRHLKDDTWQMIYKNKTLEQRYPVPAEGDAAPVPPPILGWTPPAAEEP